MAEYAIPALALSLTALTVVQKALFSAVRLKYRVEDAPVEFIPMLCEICRVETDLKVWMRFCRVRDGVPVILLERFWGTEGYRLIHLLLDNISTDCRRLCIDFSKNYESELKDLHMIDWSEADFTKIVKKLGWDNSDKHGLFGRLKDGVYRVERFRARVRRIKLNILDLQDTSQRQFDQQRYLQPLETDQRQALVDRISDEVFLNIISSVTIDTSDKVLGIMDQVWPLDLKIGRWWRMEDISGRQDITDAAVSHELKYHLIHPFNNGSIDIHVQRSTKREGNTATVTNVPQIIQNLRQERGQDRLIHTVVSATCFDILARHTNQYEGQSLRELLTEIPVTTFSDSLHCEFSFDLRIKLIFELVQTALLLIRTRWLTSLCSCSVFSRLPALGRKGYELEYTVRLNSCKHVDPVGGRRFTESEVKQWCETEILDMHICRLGIVLVEIALGAPVADAAYDDRDRIREPQIRITEKLSKWEDVLPSQIASRVDAVTSILGHDLGRAVYFCLNLKKKRDQIDDKDVVDFYKVVYQPLLQHYRKRCSARGDE